MKDATANRGLLGPARIRRALLPMAGLVLVPALTGCVRVSAPERPIEINLNINIRQEVVVRLTDDVRALRQQQPGVF